jgi:hypothetical protein
MTEHLSADRLSILAYLDQCATYFEAFANEEPRATRSQRLRIKTQAAQIREVLTCLERRLDEEPPTLAGWAIRIVQVAPDPTLSEPDVFAGFGAWLTNVETGEPPSSARRSPLTCPTSPASSRPRLSSRPCASPPRARDRRRGHEPQSLIPSPARRQPIE